MSELTKKPIKKAGQTDYDRMVELAEAYAEQHKSKAELDAEMKSTKAELLDLAAEHKDLFVDGRLELGAAYVREGEKTKPVQLENFDLAVFAAKFPDCLKQPDFNATALKTYFGNADLRGKLVKLGLDCKQEKELVVEVRKAKAA